VNELQIWQNYQNDRSNFKKILKNYDFRRSTNTNQQGRWSGKWLFEYNYSPRFKTTRSICLRAFRWKRKIHFCSLSWKITNSRNLTKRWCHSRFLGFQANFCYPWLITLHFRFEFTTFEPHNTRKTSISICRFCDIKEKYDFPLRRSTWQKRASSITNNSNHLENTFWKFHGRATPIGHFFEQKH
jgi:hypothetical protein